VDDLPDVFLHASFPGGHPGPLRPAGAHEAPSGVHSKKSFLEIRGFLLRATAPGREPRRSRPGARRRPRRASQSPSPCRLSSRRRGPDRRAVDGEKIARVSLHHVRVVAAHAGEVLRWHCRRRHSTAPVSPQRLSRGAPPLQAFRFLDSPVGALMLCRDQERVAKGARRGRSTRSRKGADASPLCEMGRRSRGAMALGTLRRRLVGERLEFVAQPPRHPRAAKRSAFGAARSSGRSQLGDKAPETRAYRRALATSMSFRLSAELGIDTL